MKNLFKILYTFFILIAGLGSAKAYTEQMATQTARETWWYFKQVIKDPYVSQHGFSVKMLNNQWITNITVSETGQYSGLILTDSGLVGEAKFIDSSEVLDWAFVDDKLLVGAFSFRIKSNTIKVELLTNFLGAKFIKEKCVDWDFVDRSKWKRPSDSLEFGIAFLNQRYFGGEEGFKNDLVKFFRYPPFAMEIGLVGYCYATYDVLPNGYITNIKVVQSIGAGTAEICYNSINNLSGYRAKETDRMHSFTLPIKFIF
jgi:hypothetical protein